VVKRREYIAAMSTNVLLPQVDLTRISDAARQVLTEIVTAAVWRALEEQGLRKPATPAGALRALDAAAYVGIKRSSFYKLLKEDPSLRDLSFTAGRCRMWPTIALDEWMRLRRASGHNHALP
jgi:predicted DNA-binding transcriptional regulator AlpA